MDKPVSPSPENIRGVPGSKAIVPRRAVVEIEREGVVGRHAVRLITPNHVEAVGVSDRKDYGTDEAQAPSNT